MSTWVLLFAFFFSSWTTQQQPPTAQPPVPSADKCTIEGQVFRYTGEPLRKARIILRRAEGREPGFATATDAAGKFLLKDIPPGRFRLYVERQGYVRQEFGQRTPGRPGSIMTLSPGARMRDLVFKMQPAAVITGRVFDEDREPLQNARVQLMRYTFFQGRRQLMAAGGGSTNDLGEYRIFGLAPGRYYLSASYSSGNMGLEFVSVGGDSAPQEGYAPTYYPGTSDPARAAALELKAGEELTGMDFGLIPTRAYRIRGEVFNSITGKPGTGTQIFVYARDGGSGFFFSQQRTFVNNPRGTFELNSVLPGAYTLQAIWSDEGRTYPARVNVDVGEADVEGLRVVLAPGIELPGIVRVEGPEISLSEVQVYLNSREELFSFGGGGARVKDDGAFVIPSAGEGLYDVFVNGLPDGYFLKSVYAGPNDVMERGLNVTKGAPGALELVVSNLAGTVEGQVTNAEDLPVSGAVVVLVPDPSRRARSFFYRTATTDQYGRFSLKSVRPGEYKLFAWEELEQGIYMDPDFLRPLESKGVAVRVEPSRVETRELKAIPANPLGP